ncbi:hypothetical protein [Candidatus Methanoperedens nitratireducens]|uniref:Uncharacterized protein n=1 Tax=Candidatus Methanoperedens nitratireducens TaxID=1392998 RepID=A0A284VSS7_9EURY|nr:hypothetical protein [Candidatus Methanoperedens nitroreducens]SNQ62269.1 hypothetical protein MNV_660007 [Candidatus Methanoperedens nitroreducens]
MAEAVLTTERVHGKPKDDNETTHVRIENEWTLRGDLNYLAKKLGVDINQLREERRQAEKQERLDYLAAREKKKEVETKAKEAALDKVVLEGYGTRFFVTLGDHRLKKLKDFNDFKCPTCGVPMPGIRAWLHELVGANRPIYLCSNVFNVHKAIACVDTNDLPCPNGHKFRILMQQLL